MRRAPIAIRESHSSDCIVMAKAALQTAIRSENDLFELLPSSPPYQRRVPALIAPWRSAHERRRSWPLLMLPPIAFVASWRR